MSSVRYFNQTAPFWDWVAAFEEQARQPAAEQPSDENQREEDQYQSFGFPFHGLPFGGPLPHRGRPARPPPPHHDPEEVSTDPRAPPQDGDTAEESGVDGEQHRGPHVHPHERRGGRHAHHHNRHHHGGPRGHPGGHFGRRGGRGAFGPGGWSAPRDFTWLAEMMPQFCNDFNEARNTTGTNKSQEFSPEVDVFDTTEAFVVHASLPGAKKEDIAVTWDAEKSELGIAGVVFRPGDEELLKTLALDERKVGVFDRKVRLGSRAKPALVDIDGITAKAEDGILRVVVPKVEGGYVEVKMVDIE